MYIFIYKHKMDTLPHHALSLISEYSKPMTRPDWQTSRPIISTGQLYVLVSLIVSPLNDIILSNIVETNWYKVDYYIKCTGQMKI
jgi:hypothetical protein